MDSTIKVWRNNRLDQQEDLPLADLYGRFQQSEWAARGDLTYATAMRMFLAATECVTWDQDDEATVSAFWDLVDMVREADKASWA